LKLVENSDSQTFFLHTIFMSLCVELVFFYVLLVVIFQSFPELCVLNLVSATE
jgi:hypothetical protein